MRRRTGRVPRPRASTATEDATRSVDLTATALAAGHGGRAVFEGVDLTLRPGEIHGIVGPNGAGKSTLLAALAATLPAQAGVVHAGEVPLSGLPARARAHVRALVPQQSGTTVAFTVRGLVELGRYSRRGRLGQPAAGDAAAIESALARVGVTELAERRITELSGGQLQRTYVAKALAQEAAFLLLDEPFSALDPRHQLELLAVLQSCAAAGMGVAVVLHDLTLAARLCTTISVLAERRIYASGSPSEVLTPQLLADVYGVNAVVRTDPATSTPHITLVSPLGEQ